MAEIRQKPFLAYLLDQLAEAGVGNVVLCTGYLGEQIRVSFGDSYKTLELAYSQESSPLGTAGALCLARSLCTSEPVLAMNGDSYCKVNLRVFWNWYQEQPQIEAALLLTRVSDTRRYGRVNIDPTGRVDSFDEKGIITVT